MIPDPLSPLANHLWQSTLCAAVAWLLTLTLRRNRAAVRHWIWLAASVKFLVPFSLLTDFGSKMVGRLAPEIAPPRIPAGVQQLGRPFDFQLDVTPFASPGAPSNLVPAVLVAVWLCGLAISAIVWFGLWRRLRASLRASTPLPLDLPIPVMCSPGRQEPGVFGILRPVLLLPEGIADRLSPAQLRSILAHELCHVRRRDNLGGALHMVVESIFWFHPLVWWIGARLVEERELACDEEVVRLGNEPQTYAEGILSVCKLYASSPIACASGVTGADLKKRIEAIVNARISDRLTHARKLLLAVAGMAAVAGPIWIGVVNAPHGRAQSKADGLTFEVASIKPSDPNLRQGGIGVQPGGNFRALNMSLKQLITWAYNISCGKDCDNYVLGGPGWASSQRFDIVAKPAQPENITDRKILQDRGRERLRVLLAERFQLKIREEAREMSVYALTVAKGGHKLKEVVKEYTGDGPSSMGGGAGDMYAVRAPIGMLTVNLAQAMGRPVLDQTGLKGAYDFKLKYAAPRPAPKAGDAASDKPEGLAASDPEGPSLSEALQEQLGLKLEAQKGAVKIIVIDSAEKPDAN